LINIIKPEFKQVPVVGNAATEMVDSVNDANERVVSSATKIADKGVDVVATTVGGVPGTFGNQVLHRGEEPDIGNAIKTSLRNIVVPPIVKDEAKFHANLAKELVGDPLKLIELADPIGHFEVSAAAQAKELGLIKSESECKQVAGMGVDAATAAADAELGPVAGAIMNVASGEQAATACETASKVHTAPIAQR